MQAYTGETTLIRTPESGNARSEMPNSRVQACIHSMHHTQADGFFWLNARPHIKSSKSPARLRYIDNLAIGFTETDSDISA